MVKAIRYRVKQFLRALTARISEEEVERAIRILTPEARALFRRQAVQDQRHGLDTLRQAGHTNPQLLAAALLHDVGKAATHCKFSTGLRTVFVLLERFAPRLLARLIQRHRFFVAYAQHPETGACWAREAGCSPLTVALIRRHEERQTNCQIETEKDRLLVALQAADSVN